MADEDLKEPVLEDLPEDDEPSLESEETGDEDEDGAEPSDETEDEESEDDPDEDPDDPQEDPDEGLPKGVKKRIDTLTAKRHAAERRAEASEAECARLRKLVGADDPKAIIDVAKRHGILTDLIGADEAKGLVELDRKERQLSIISDTLDDLEDSEENEVELGGKSYTAGQLRKLRRQTERDLEELREAYSDIRKSLSARTAKLLRLGLAAEKEAARAGKQKSAGKKARQTKTERVDDFDDPPRTQSQRRTPRREPRERGVETGGMSARDQLRRFTMDIARRTERRRE